MAPASGCWCCCRSWRWAAGSACRPSMPRRRSATAWCCWRCFWSPASRWWPDGREDNAMTFVSKPNAEPLRVDPSAVEEAAKLLYIRACKILPDDIKQGFARLDADETDGTAKTILATMIENIGVAERMDNLLCQDTGIPI